MNKFKPLCFLPLLLLARCAPPSLVGTWQIHRYEITTPDGGMAVEQIGKIAFQKNGAGERRLTIGIPILEIEDGTYPFSWKQPDKQHIVISGADAVFSKTWEIQSASRNLYKLKAPYNPDVTQLMELRR